MRKTASFREAERRVPEEDGVSSQSHSWTGHNLPEALLPGGAREIASGIVPLASASSMACWCSKTRLLQCRLEVRTNSRVTRAPTFSASSQKPVNPGAESTPWLTLLTWVAAYRPDMKAQASERPTSRLSTARAC